MARKANPPVQEIFLSHSSRNRSFTRKLAGVLRDHGLPVWYSETNIVGAQQWHDEVGQALSRCDWFLVVLTPASVNSPWVKRELVYALNDPRYENHIVPVLYRACEHKRLSWALPGYQFVDFTGEFTKGCLELLRVWGLAYKGKKDST